MPKRNRGKNTKKGNESSTIPVDSDALKPDILPEITPVDKASAREIPENIQSETLQVDVKDNEKNQVEIQSAEKQNDNVIPKLAKPQHLESKEKEVEKPSVQTPIEPLALKQEPHLQSVKKSEQAKPVNKNNKQSKTEQKKTETTEVKPAESMKNEQGQNKPGNQSETKQPDQQKKSETKKAEQHSPAAKQKENNKKPEPPKSDSSTLKKDSSENQEKVKESLNEQTKLTKSGKSNPKQTQSPKSETKPNKLSTAKEQQTSLINHDSKQCDTEKNNGLLEESDTKDSVHVKDEVKENKSAKPEIKKPEIDINHGRCKTTGKQSAPVKQSAKQSRTPGPNINEQSIVEENEQSKTQALSLTKKSDFDNKQQDIEENTEKCKSNDKPYTTSKKGGKSGDLSGRENRSGKEVQSKTELKQSEASKSPAKPETKKPGKSDTKQVIPNKSNDKKVEHKKPDSKQAVGCDSVKLADTVDATQSVSQEGKKTETVMSVNSELETAKLPSTKSETKRVDSKEEDKRKSDVNLTVSNINAEKVQLKNNQSEPESLKQSEPESLKQSEALLINTDLQQAIKNKQSDITTSSNEKAGLSDLDMKDAMLDGSTTAEDINDQINAIKQSIPLKEEIQYSDDKHVECNKPDSLKTNLAIQQAEKPPQEEYEDELEQGKSNLFVKEGGKPRESKKGSAELKDCKMSEIEVIDPTKVEVKTDKSKKTGSMEIAVTTPSLALSDLIEIESSVPIVKETEIESSKAENIQLAATTNEKKMPLSNRVTIKTEPLTYAQVAEIPKIENKTNSAEEQTNNFSNSSAKQDDGLGIGEQNDREGLSCSLPNPIIQEESENKKESFVLSSPRNIETENKEAKAESKPKEATESNAAANSSPNICSSSIPDVSQVQEMPSKSTGSQEESVNVQELTEHVMNILNEGGTDQHDLLKKNVELQQFIVKLIHLLKEKTDLCANLDRQNSALTSQSKSLKDVIAITKDLLEIRNLEVDRLHGDLNLMENAIKEERTRHNTAVQHLTEAMGINDKLKKEYHIQMDLFEKLKEKYTEKVVILTRENLRMKALLQQHGIDPSAVPDCMLPADPDNLEPSQTETVDK